MRSAKTVVIVSALVALLAYADRLNATTYQFQQNVINGVTATGSYNTEDTGIRTGQPNSTFDTNLSTNGANSVLFRFDSSAIPTSYTATSATLSLVSTYGGPSVSTINYDVYAMPSGNTTWTETTATYANQNETGPVAWIGGANAKAAAQGSTLIASLAVAPGLNDGVTVTFTFNGAGLTVLNGWIANPSSNSGFMIFDTNNNSGFYSSEEGTASFRPLFTVNTVPEPGSLSLIMIGSVGVFGMVRRRRSA